MPLIPPRPASTSSSVTGEEASAGSAGAPDVGRDASAGTGEPRARLRIEEELRPEQVSADAAVLADRLRSLEARFNVMLDVGADIRADAEDLLQYALMGASYARNGLGLTRPRIGLLNVGTEEHKGRAELKVANEMIAAAAEKGEFAYVGFVEGGDLPSDKVDVIVTERGVVRHPDAQKMQQLFPGC